MRTPSRSQRRFSRASLGGLATAALTVTALAITALATPNALASAGAPGAVTARPGSQNQVLTGLVAGGGTGLAGYRVSLFANYLGQGPHWARLGTTTSDAAGHFDLAYSLRKAGKQSSPLLFLKARRGQVTLVSALGSASSLGGGSVTVNERTTVATGTAYARFVLGGRIDGNKYGMSNAAQMAANLADPATGSVGAVLASVPNGSETSTLATFNSLTNVVNACVASSRSCADLFAATAAPAGRPSRNVLQAVAAIAEFPSYPAYRGVSGDPLFELSQRTPVNTPALTEAPTNWLLYLKFTGGPYSVQDSDNLINGIGNFAIDAKGFAWGNDNAEPRPQGSFACAGQRLLEFDPSGRPVPGTPYTGGGLKGVGYGITLDPHGNVWVGNFGFQDPPCALDPDLAAPHNSVSEFGPDGDPISGDDGFTEGDISWPQGTISDRRGNIWLANCGNDSVTMYPNGNRHRAVNIPLGPTPRPHDPQMKPFGLAPDAHGNIWVVNNRGNSLSVISPRGKLLDTLPGTYQGKTVLSHPVANAADLEGNIWVTNSDWLDSPCPTRTQLGTAENPSITMFRHGTRTPYPGSPFTGGGLTLPWGIAVDGDDTVWAFNFGNSPVQPDGSQPTDVPTGISRFCGIRTANCPPGFKVGDPITPDTGYRSDSIERITGAEIDPSGNIWITNNWKLDANPFVNPFGNSFVIAIGAAAPLKTPLIGPPVSFSKRR